MASRTRSCARARISTSGSASRLHALGPRSTGRPWRRRSRCAPSCRGQVRWCPSQMDGVEIALPQLEEIVVLNIPRCVRMPTRPGHSNTPPRSASRSRVMCSRAFTGRPPQLCQRQRPVVKCAWTGWHPRPSTDAPDTEKNGRSASHIADVAGLVLAGVLGRGGAGRTAQASVRGRRAGGSGEQFRLGAHGTCAARLFPLPSPVALTHARCDTASRHHGVPRSGAPTHAGSHYHGP